MSIEAWLRGLGLEQHADACTENGVGLNLLPELTNEDLKDLGVDRLVDRKTILKAIERLSESEDELAAEPSEAPPTSGERRQVTVLFADIAGYTKHSSELGAERQRRRILHPPERWSNVRSWLIAGVKDPIVRRSLCARHRTFGSA